MFFELNFSKTHFLFKCIKMECALSECMGPTGYVQKFKFWAEYLFFGHRRKYLVFPKTSHLKQNKHDATKRL